jgi:hypothetical protein
VKADKIVHHSTKTVFLSRGFFLWNSLVNS